MAYTKEITTGEGRVTAYNGIYGEAVPERDTFSSLNVREIFHFGQKG